MLIGIRGWLGVRIKLADLFVILTMAKAKKVTVSKIAYLTKRQLASAARAGIRDAAARTMEVMGYTVVAHKGWVVKKFADGSIEKLKPLAKQKDTTVKLD